MVNFRRSAAVYNCEINKYYSIETGTIIEKTSARIPVTAGQKIVSYDQKLHNNIKQSKSYI